MRGSRRGHERYINEGLVRLVEFGEEGGDMEEGNQGK